MYHLTDGDGEPVDPNEMRNLGNPSVVGYDEPTIVAKRTELAQRLAVLEQERLQPLSEGDSGGTYYLPFVRQGSS